MWLGGDPAAPGRLAGGLAALVILWPLLEAAEVRPGTLLDPANLRVIGGFLAGFWPLASEADFLALLARATLETLAIATAGLTLAIGLAVPLAYTASAAGRERASRNMLLRGLLTVLRGVPELVWALLFVRVFGLGPTAGVLALGLTYGGMLAKVYAEILESTDPAPARALRQAGSGRGGAVLYGLLPQASSEFASYTVYRWECALRASVVMGFVGAGGLGQLMDQAMKMLNGGEAATLLLAFVALVLAADALSSLLRQRLAAPPPPRRVPLGAVGGALLLALPVAVAGSFALLDLGLGALASCEALLSMGEFAVAFLRPDGSMAWLGQVLRGTGETLAISVVGTLLAALGGLALAVPHPRAPFILFCNGLRAVPELVWATLTALAAGLGPFAGVLALALHTAGVLGRLYGEALDNAPPAPARALRSAGAPRGMAFCYGTLPGAAPQLVAYTLYRWEMNIRMAAVLGFVGAGGLGQLLYVELSLFHHDRAATVILAMLVLSMAVDQASAWLRQRMG